MKSLVACITLGFLVACTAVRKQETVPTSASEPYRPRVHFTPASGWMNDPNGMVYQNGTYHLFYQHYPDNTVWGPMHWGHATSTDLIHWQHQPIALYPDSLGYIFSGSAVVDVNNTSGFGANGQVPLVAIFTHHDTTGEKGGKNNFQNQSLAYSLDGGKTWTKYAHNPVLKNPGIRDFRDPKVSWHEPTKRWIMTLATLDHITFYSSPNLKDWTEESAFGKDIGAHGGVWECPDLFSLPYNGDSVWVLIVNLNPGGPNGGSATQYFTGTFDGHAFTPFQTDTRWLDYGPDEYAGITWTNTGSRKIFMGWMSNWLYADRVPTKKWRSAMTVPRELLLQKIADRYYVASKPVQEFQTLMLPPRTFKPIDATQTLSDSLLQLPAYIHLTADTIQNFAINLTNNIGEALVIGYEKEGNRYFIDRTKSGQSAFHNQFAATHYAPRLTENSKLDLTLILDVASVELFADSGLSVMTSIFFPTVPYTKLNLQSKALKIDSLQIGNLKFAHIAAARK